MTELELLSRLWVEEPDAGALDAAEGIGISCGGASASELSEAYSELFLMNVYPYGTVFTDDLAELAGPGARRAAALYEHAGWAPPALARAAAADHVGLCLGFLAHAHAGAAGLDAAGFLSECAEWIPTCALAVERNPTTHAFYRAVAARTRDAVLDRAIPDARLSVGETVGAEEDEEADLGSVLSFLLVPARCGMFLSRARLGALAREAGLRLPFGTRFDVARALFSAAGDAGAVDALLSALVREAECWRESYVGFGRAYPAWAPAAERWFSRIDRTLARLQEMRQTASDPVGSRGIIG